MKVFMTGASGYIGSAVAAKLKERGHAVLALARSDEADRRLRALGHETVRGDLFNRDALTAAARASDGVIHAASTNDRGAAEADRTATLALLAGTRGRRAPFVYTSGTWLFGDTGARPAREDSPLAPTPIVAWREAIERDVLAETDARTVVVRPSVVYGNGGGLPAMMVAQGKRDGVVRHVGPGSTRWTMVHVDDLADLYVRVLERAPEKGEIALGTSDQVLTVAEIAAAAAEAAGISGKVAEWPLTEARAVMGPFADALALDQHVDSRSTRTRFEWSPSGPGALADIARGSYARV